MEMNSEAYQRDITERLNTRAYANQLLATANWHAGKCNRRIKWSVFFGFLGVLLVVGIAFGHLPLMNGKPLYVIDHLLEAILLIVGAAINLIAMITAGTANTHHRKATELLIQRGDLLNSTHLYVTMVKEND